MLEQYGEHKFMLIALVQHPIVYDKIKAHFGDDISYGPVHGVQFHDRHGAVTTDVSMYDKAYHIATACECAVIAGWSGSMMFEYVQALGEFHDVINVPESGYLHPLRYDIHSDGDGREPPKSFMEIPIEGAWKKKSMSWHQLLLANAKHLGGQFVSFKNVPVEN